MKEILNLDFCRIEIYSKYIVAEMNEGIIVVPDFNKLLVDMAIKYFKNSPFVYITHRVNSYSVDPKIYIETAKIDNLKGFAVVTDNYQAKINAQIEKLFLDKPFETFEKLEEAFNWAENLIE